VKKIEAIFRPFKLEDVHEALAGIGVKPMYTTFEAARGSGLRGVLIELHRGTTHVFDDVSMVKLELVVSDRQVREVRDVITAAARTGRVGDGKLVISPVAELVSDLACIRGGRHPKRQTRATCNDTSLTEGDVQ
jgi:nitrogen regulatory protein P-II 1